MNSDLPETILYPVDTFLILNTNRAGPLEPFLLPLHMQYRLKKKQKVLLLLTGGDWENLNSVASKLGVNVALYKQQGLLDYVEVMSEFSNSSSVDFDFESWSKIALEKTESLPDNSVVMLDDLSLLYLLCPRPAQVFQFLDKLLQILKRKARTSALICSASETDEERIEAHLGCLKNLADVWIDCGPALSGFSQNFDGIARFLDSRTGSSSAANFKLQPRTVNFTNI